MAKQKQADFSLLMQKALLVIDQRVRNLELISRDAGIEIVNRDKKWRDVIATYKSHIKALNDDMGQLKKTIADYEKNLSVMSQDFKILITKEDLKKLQARVDEWPLEFFAQKEIVSKD